MSYWQNKQVLVTGGAGFIGSHVVRRLVGEGSNVTVVDSLQSGKWENVQEAIADLENTAITICSEKTDRRSVLQVQCIEADVRNGQAMRNIVRDIRPDVVMHLAANASVPGSVADPAYDYASNASGTFNLLEAVRMECPKARVVVASSAAVYGEPAYFPITESSELAPISPYGASKLVAEVEAGMFHKVYNIQVVIARLFNTYGPGMPRFVILDFLKKLQADPTHLEILGSGTQLRDFNYVEDTVEGLLLLAERGVAGEAYNIATGKSHSVTELANILIGILGLTDKTRLSFTGESWRGDAQRWEVDNSKIASLGYSPKVTLASGVAKVAEWYSVMSRNGEAGS
jgi:UDP-glucose 4-epimerase